MRRSLHALEPVLGKRQTPSLSPFLELGLGITRRPGEGAHPFLPVPSHEALRSLEPAVEKDGTDHRLETVREDARMVAATRFLLTPGEPDPSPEGDLTRHLGEHVPACEMAKPASQCTLGISRVVREEEPCDHEAEDAIAQKFEPFVAAQPAPPATCKARVGERFPEQFRCVETIAEDLFKLAQIGGAPDFPAIGHPRVIRWA